MRVMVAGEEVRKRVLQDAQPHPDGWRTVAYLDGHFWREKPRSDARLQAVLPE